MFGFSPGLVYRWDVLQWVPFAGAGVGVYTSKGLASREDGLQFGVSGRAGLDYLLSRDVVLGVQASAHFVLTGSDCIIHDGQCALKARVPTRRWSRTQAVNRSSAASHRTIRKR